VLLMFSHWPCRCFFLQLPFAATSAVESAKLFVIAAFDAVGATHVQKNRWSSSMHETTANSRARCRNGSCLSKVSFYSDL